MYISDHMPIYIVKKKYKSAKLTESYMGRPYKLKSYDRSLLTANLRESDWRKFYWAESVNDKWDIMHNRIFLELNTQCPNEV